VLVVWMRAEGNRAVRWTADFSPQSRSGISSGLKSAVQYTSGFFPGLPPGSRAENLSP
jgi:hypothetical protein